MTTTKFKGIKKAAEYRRGELTKDILRLVGAGVVTSVGLMAPNTLQLIDYFNPKGKAERQRIWRAIKYLESRNRVSIYTKEGKRYVRLTSQGELALTEQSIDQMTVAKPRRWDHKWRFVMFDVPVRHSSTSRHSFRAKLEDLGFKLYQRSVFIYPYECNEEVHTVAKWYGLDQYIRYVVATEVHDMRKFVQLFDLLDYDA